MLTIGGFWRLGVLVDHAFPTVILRYPELKSPTKITQELVQFAELGPSPAEIRTAVAFMDSPQGTSARAIGINSNTATDCIDIA
jgi:hypothetical protein